MTSALPPDDALARAYQQLVARHRGQGAPVRPEELLQVVQRSGSEASRLEVLSRIAMDPDAQRDLALLQSAQALAPAPSRMFFRSTMALAATLVLAVGLWRWQGASAGNAERGDASGLDIIAPAPHMPVSAGTRLAWHPLSSASRYEVELLDAEGARVWSIVTTDTVVVLPETTSLAAASLWFVNATTPGGVVRSTPREITAAVPPKSR